MQFFIVNIMSYCAVVLSNVAFDTVGISSSEMMADDEVQIQIKVMLEMRFIRRLAQMVL